MCLARKLSRAFVAVMSLVTSATAVSVTQPLAAHAETYDETTVIIPTPDLANLRPGCTTAVTARRRVTPGGTNLTKFAGVVLTSTDCDWLEWTPRVYIQDDAPPYKQLGHGSVGAPGNPASTSVTQSVPYGMGVREAGVTTLVFYGTSRVGYVCLQERWEFDIVRWRPTLLNASNCDHEYVEMLGLSSGR